VLGDDEGLWREKAGHLWTAEELQCGGVFGVGLPRWIEKDDIELRGGSGELVEQSGRAARFDAVAGADAKRSEILVDRGDGGSSLLGEIDVLGPSAESLDADRPRASVEVGETGSGDTGR